MKLRLIAATLLSLMVVTPTLAQSRNDYRQYRQDQRIERGIATGQLTPREARRLDRQQNRIARSEFRMRARNGGYLTLRNRARLERQQDRASRNIYRKKNNYRSY